MKFNGEKVLRIRHGYGSVFQVQTKPGAIYQDARKCDLTIETYADAQALGRLHAPGFARICEAVMSHVLQGLYLGVGFAFGSALASASWACLTRFVTWMNMPVRS